MKDKILRLIIISIITFAVISCVSKSDYQELENTRDQLKMQVDSLNANIQQMEKEYQLLKNSRNNYREDYNDLNEKYTELRRSQTAKRIENNRKPFVSEENALTYIKDFYDFNSRKYKFRNVRLRRMDRNKFKVSLEEFDRRELKLPNYDIEYYWKPKIRILEVDKNNRYDLSYGY